MDRAGLPRVGGVRVLVRVLGRCQVREPVRRGRRVRYAPGRALPRGRRGLCGAVRPVQVEVGQQGAGQEEHRPYAAVGRAGVDGDAEAVAGGEDADDGEAELGRVAEPGDVGDALAAQQGRGLLHLVAVHADAGVVDDDAGAVVHRLEADLDGGVGLRVAGRVVEQLGDGQHDGLHGAGDDGDVGLAVDLDAAVVADAGLRAAHHVGHGGGGALAARPGAAEHGDGLGAAAELRVGVVDLQQVAEHVGVVVPVLHVGDGQLLLVGEPLEGAHRRLQGRLGGLLGACFGPVPGLAEEVHHGLEAVRVRGAGEPLVEQAGRGHRLVRGVLDRGEPDRRQMVDLLVPGPQAALQGGGALTDARGDLPLAHQQDEGHHQGRRQAPDHRRRYVISHQFLRNKRDMSIWRDGSASRRPPVSGTR